MLADNPELQGPSLPDAEITPEDWRLVSLEMLKPDGGLLRIQLLRPVDWLLEQALLLVEQTDDLNLLRPRPLTVAINDAPLADLLLGRGIELDLPELGAQGEAQVVGIAPCPELEAADGPGRRVITGTFRHSAGNVLKVTIEGESEPMGVTANHPFWSADRQAFVAAGELRVGEHFQRADGTLTQITRLTPHRGPPVEVFNLEIDTEHVYHVGNGGVLVHNSCVGHGYGIFNNKTGEVVKFGISRAKKLLTKTGLSVRAQNQLTALASKLGIPRSDLSSVILRDNFKNAKALFQWEDEVVGIWRSWKNIPQLPFNLRPRGVPF